MSYDNAILEAKAVDAVRKYNLISIEEVVLHLPCCRKTFYRNELTAIIYFCIDKGSN